MTLGDYLKKHKISVTAFAAQIGVDPDSVYRYRDGTRRPKWSVMPKIVEATGGKVTADSFLGRAQPKGERVSARAA